MAHLKGRLLGNTENTWCRAVSGGTGVTVAAFLTAKSPDSSALQNALRKIQNSHAVLRSHIRISTPPTTFSFVTPPSSSLQVKSFDLPHTAALLRRLTAAIRGSHAPPSHFQLILEHELNNATWTSEKDCNNLQVLFASVYALPGSQWVLVLRFHTAACDRTTASGLLRELMLAVTAEGKEEEARIGKFKDGGGGGVRLAIEDHIPRGKGKKALWARGVDVLGYSVSSLRLSNMRFEDAKLHRSSELARLQMDPEDTGRVLAGCELKGIKLCGALTAAGLIAAHSLSKNRNDQQRKKYYGVVTLTDCRSALEPPFSSHDYGFYHSAILNVHLMKGGETFWELADRCYAALANSKKCNKHFSDMGDLNFLMCKAIQNPGLTPSSSLRTSFLSVFEDPVIDDKSPEIHAKLGLEDFVGCSSVHGVGPSIAVFDTVREGRLDCACVYPSPLHSREQMRELVDRMKSVLANAAAEGAGMLGPKCG